MPIYRSGTTADEDYRRLRAKLAADHRWGRKRGEDTITDRKRRLHAALDKLIDAAAGDLDLLHKLEDGVNSGALLDSLEEISKKQKPTP